MTIAELKDGKPRFESTVDISNLGTYLVIENSGEIDIQALELLGASTKDGIISIGEFGSGNKYALAYFVRNNIDLTILSGTEEVKVKKERVMFRNQAFNKIIIGDRETSITDNLGKKDWSMWMAMREIICNSIDEEDFKIYTTNKIIKQSNKTQFVFLLEAGVLEYVLKIEDYFAWDRKVILEGNGISSGTIKVYEKEIKSFLKIYRKGILIADFKIPSLYDYDLEKVEINESRVLKDNSEKDNILRYVGESSYSSSPTECYSYIDSIVRASQILIIEEDANGGMLDNFNLFEFQLLENIDYQCANIYYSRFFKDLYFVNFLLYRKYEDVINSNLGKIRLVPHLAYTEAKRMKRSIFDMKSSHIEEKFTEREVLMLKKVEEVFKTVDLVIPKVKKMASEDTVNFTGERETGTIHLYDEDFNSIMELFSILIKKHNELAGRSNAHFLQLYIKLLFEKHCIIL